MFYAVYHYLRNQFPWWIHVCLLLAMSMIGIDLSCLCPTIACCLYQLGVYTPSYVRGVYVNYYHHFGIQAGATRIDIGTTDNYFQTLGQISFDFLSNLFSNNRTIYHISGRNFQKFGKWRVKGQYNRIGLNGF